MLRKSVALAAGFTAVLSLLNLNTAGPITFGLSAGETSADAFTVYGTLDASAVDDTNAQNLGSFTGDTPDEVLAGYAQQAATWPYVLVGRDDGSTAGTFYATGDEAAASTVASQAAPVVVGDYTTVFDLSAYGAAGVRIGGDRNMTAGDAFLVYASQVSVASSAGCKLIARITGGGGTNQISALVVGYPFAIVQRAAGSTAGNILAAGVAAPGVTPPGTAYVQGGNAFGATGVLGLTDANTLRIIANNTVFAQDDGTTTTIGRTGGASALTLDAGTGTIGIGVSASARTISIGTGAAVQTITIGSTNGASTLTLDAGTGTIGIGVSASARTINIGTGAAVQTINIGTGAAGHVITIGSTTDPAEIRLRCSRGVGINTAGTPDASALLELVSTTRGLLLPRMTTGERDAIAGPASGLLIYNTSTNKLNFRAAAAWEAVTSA